MKIILSIFILLIPLSLSAEMVCIKRVGVKVSSHTETLEGRDWCSNVWSGKNYCLLIICKLTRMMR